MKNSVKIRVRNAVVALLLAGLYGLYAFDTIYYYGLQPGAQRPWPDLWIALVIAIFLLLCGYFSRVVMFLCGAAAVVILALTSASIHFYVSETRGVGDFSGINGAWHLALILGAALMYMFLATAALVTAVKYALRKIASYRHGRRS